MHELHHTVWGHFMAMWRQPSASRMGPYDQSLFLAVVRLATVRNVVNRNGDCSRLSRWSFRQRRIQSNAWGPDTRCSESSLMFSLCSVNLSDGSRIRYRNQSKSTESTESTESLYPAVRGMNSTSHERSCSRWRTWNLRSNPLFENHWKPLSRASKSLKAFQDWSLLHSLLHCSQAHITELSQRLERCVRLNTSGLSRIRCTYSKFINIRYINSTCSLHVRYMFVACLNRRRDTVLDMNWNEILVLKTRSARFTWPLCDGWPSFSEWRAEMHRVDSQLLNTK